MYQTGFFSSPQHIKGLFLSKRFYIFAVVKGTRSSAEYHTNVYGVLTCFAYQFLLPAADTIQYSPGLCLSQELRGKFIRHNFYIRRHILLNRYDPLHGRLHSQQLIESLLIVVLE